jgi:hypothetical protein
MRRLCLASAFLWLQTLACQAAAPPPHCRATGVLAEQGETLCIPTHAGLQRARCGKVLNVSSWTFLEGACPAPAATEPDAAAQPSGETAPKPD